MTNLQLNGFYTGEETLQEIIKIGTKKATQKVPKHMLLGLIGGIYIGFSGIQVSITVGGAEGIRNTNPGVAYLMFGALFSLGFIFSVICGGEIFTDGLVYMIPPFLGKHIKFRNIMSNWIITFLMNLMGAFISAWLLTYESDLLNKDPFNEWIKDFASEKVHEGWFILLLRGVSGGYLAGLAFFLAHSAQDVMSKIMAIFFPILVFGALNLEHVTASMYFIITALLYKAPGITFFKFLWHNLLPVTIGNILGATIMVGSVYYYLYHRHPNYNDLDDDYNEKREEELNRMIIDEDYELEVPTNVTRVFRTRKVTSVVKSSTQNEDNLETESSVIGESSD